MFLYIKQLMIANKLKQTPKFNTVLWSKLGSNFKTAYKNNKLSVDGKEIKYPKTGPFPNVFDPRDPKLIPEDELPDWFFKDSSGNIQSILTIPLDQAKCGSCWAFSTSNMFTDTLRHMILYIFKDKACIYSKLFNPINTCTGETGVEQAVEGVVNIATEKNCSKNSDCESDVCLPSGKCQNLVNVEVRDRISSYYTVGFAPKMKDDCSQSFEKCTIDCSLIYNDWKQGMQKGHTLKHFAKELGELEDDCSGCEGNAIIMPLYMFAKEGASLISDFPVQDWGCLFGNEQMRKTFCTEEFLNKDMEKKLPDLIKCDRYGHFTSEDLSKGNKPDNIETMEQWIKAEIINNSSLTIGFAVYPAFFDFFQKNPKGIFSFNVFKDYINKGGQSMAGGHAVTIVGWGEQEIDDEIIQYWIVRNSWGEKWGDGGFFKFEIGMDNKLTANGLEKYKTNFEDEIGTVYFAPFPDPLLFSESDYQELDIEGNKLKVTKNILAAINLPPSKECKSIRSNKNVTDVITTCSCPLGYIRNTNGICTKDHSLNFNKSNLKLSNQFSHLFRETDTNANDTNVNNTNVNDTNVKDTNPTKKTSNIWMIIFIIIFVVALLIALFLFFRKIRKDKLNTNLNPKLFSF